MSIACPRFIMPSRRTVTRDSWDFYLDMKAKLKEVFMVCEGRICLTTDTWTSIKQMNYMIIGFRQVFSHKGTAIAEAIMACLDEWGIDKVFSVTVDNASSNDTAIQHIKNMFDNRNTSVCDGQFLHVRCVAHIINLVVSDGLGEISTSVRKIRETVRYVKQSPARLQKFYDFVAVEDRESKKSLCLDVPTRWNSTFLMLQAAEKYETAFEMYALSDRQFRIDLISKVDSRGGITSLGVPDEDDWNDARRIMGFLEYKQYKEEVDGVIYKTELDKYLREEPDDTPDPKFSVLDWWKLNSHCYPILSQMARDVLAVPISTVSSESAFSTGGRVLDAFRSSLTPRIVEALICTQDWLRADSRAPSIEEDQLDIDKIDEGKR
ncbi:Zinc finger BED domain-containing protein RICESLEEPER 2 [Linum perenne]